jgi:hypothetical protein
MENLSHLVKGHLRGNVLQSCRILSYNNCNEHRLSSTAVIILCVFLPCYRRVQRAQITFDERFGWRAGITGDNLEEFLLCDDNATIRLGKWCFGT